MVVEPGVGALRIPRRNVGKSLPPCCSLLLKVAKAAAVLLELRLMPFRLGVVVVTATAGQGVGGAGGAEVAEVASDCIGITLCLRLREWGGGGSWGVLTRRGMLASPAGGP